MAKITDTPGYTTMPNKPPSGGQKTLGPKTPGYTTMPGKTFPTPKITDTPGYTTMPGKTFPSPKITDTPGYTTMPNKAPSGAPQGVRPASPADRSNNPNRVATVIGKVGDYLGNIGQNVRDVGTAAGTNVQIARNEPITQSSPLNKAGTNNFINQAKEVAGSLIGRPGTRSDQYKPGVGYIKNTTPNSGS